MPVNYREKKALTAAAALTAVAVGVFSLYKDLSCTSWCY